jgi:drug/metabolite transporter (DMT)-like permease
MLVGTLLLGGGNSVVCWAEQWVPSGEAALIVATVPLWMTALPWLAGRAGRPRLPALAGVALGLAGVALLVGGAARAGAAGGAALMAGRAALLVASLSWSVGSLLSRRLPLPAQPVMASALEMLAAAPVIALAAALNGEWAHFHLGAVPRDAWLALGYLIVFGSLAGFGSYVYLLKHTSASRASTYAFVNPLVAVLLGTLVAHEPLGARTVSAAALIVCAVGAVVWGTSARSAD